MAKDTTSKHDTTTAAPDDKPSAKSAAAHAPTGTDPKAKEGHPDQLAQIRHSSPALGPRTLVQALDELPRIPPLDGLRVNAANGYYGSVGRDELVKALEGLPLPPENAGALAARDALVARAKTGEFSRG